MKLEIFPRSVIRITDTDTMKKVSSPHYKRKFGRKMQKDTVPLILLILQPNLLNLGKSASARERELEIMMYHLLENEYEYEYSLLLNQNYKLMIVM
mmetsp:Transcript_13517/g.20510  ORF Transcript_13517/g.20510 Transcript_13517/m.20510 type:complete len:96 (-) Transcript_13517:41-328(-)